MFVKNNWESFISFTLIIVINKLYLYNQTYSNKNWYLIACILFLLLPKAYQMQEL